MTESNDITDFRMPTACKWAAPRAVADGGGGTIIATAEIAASPERVFAPLKDRRKTVIDGPFAEAKDVVRGYIVVEAQDLAQAVEISKYCPILEVDGSVEVRPIKR